MDITSTTPAITMISRALEARPVYIGAAAIQRTSVPLLTKKMPMLPMSRDNVPSSRFGAHEGISTPSMEGGSCEVIAEGRRRSGSGRDTARHARENGQRLGNWY